MNCKEYASLQSQYLDGALDATTAKEIRAHLSECPSCRCLHGKAKNLLHTLRHIEDDVEIPDNLAAEIFQAVRKGPKREKEGFHLPKFLRAWQFYSVPAACLLIYTVMYGLSGAHLPAADETLVYTVKPPEKIHYSLPALPAAWPLQPQESPAPTSEPVTPTRRTTGGSFTTQNTQENTALTVDPYTAPMAVSSPKLFSSPEVVYVPEVASSPEKVSLPAEASPTPAPATPTPSFSITGGRRPASSGTPKPSATSAPANTGHTSDQSQTSAKTYPTVSSLVKRSITFVVDDADAAAVFQSNKDKGEQAVRLALSRAGFDFTTRESVAEEYAPSYNALAKDATALAARIAKGETSLSTLLSEKEWKMQTMREDCATPTLRLAYQ